MYSYDNLDRLVSVTYSDGTSVAYEYDTLNNRTKETYSNGDVKNYVYNHKYQLTEIKLNGAVTDTFTYNGSGAVVTHNNKTYTYDEWDRMSGYSDGTSTYTYKYDANGIRTQKNDKQYVIDKNNNVVAETDSTGAITDEILWGNQPLARKTNGSWYYYIYNAHGDVVGLVNNSGTIVNTYEYTPWGEIKSENETVDNPIKYAGEYYDELDMIYLRARYYAPSIGRFTSLDIEEGELSKPLDMNRYVYCRNNPIMSNQANEEIKYLLDIINDVQYHKRRFKLMYGEDRYVFGVVSGKEALGPAPFSKLMEYKTLYDTLRDLDYKIKISFCKAIELAYSDAFNEFSLFDESTTEQQNTYYYIENALFRTSILWDLLAQFYRLYYNIEIDKTKVYYNQIFNPDREINEKFKEKAREIHKYIIEEDNTDCEGEWKGNHKFVNEQRNKMTHRNSPNVGVMSDFDINLKMQPAFILKRIIEDYSVVSKQLLEILNLIEKDEVDNFEEIILNE